jgi:hypothetical protein
MGKGEEMRGEEGRGTLRDNNQQVDDGGHHHHHHHHNQ